MGIRLFCIRRPPPFRLGQHILQGEFDRPRFAIPEGAKAYQRSYRPAHPFDEFALGHGDGGQAVDRGDEIANLQPSHSGRRVRQYGGDAKSRALQPKARERSNQSSLRA
jgi:hypothetical protein